MIPQTRHRLDRLDLLLFSIAYQSLDRRERPASANKRLPKRRQQAAQLP